MIFIRLTALYCTALFFWTLFLSKEQLSQVQDYSRSRNVGVYTHNPLLLAGIITSAHLYSFCSKAKYFQSCIFTEDGPLIQLPKHRQTDDRQTNTRLTEQMTVRTVSSCSLTFWHEVLTHTGSDHWPCIAYISQQTASEQAMMKRKKKSNNLKFIVNVFIHHNMSISSYTHRQ